MPLRLSSRSLVLPSRGCVASRVAVETEALNLTRISPSLASLHFLGNLWLIIDRSSKIPALTGIDSSRPRAASMTHRWLRVFSCMTGPLLVSSVTCPDARNSVRKPCLARFLGFSLRHYGPLQPRLPQEPHRDNTDVIAITQARSRYITPLPANSRAANRRIARLVDAAA